MADSTLKVKLNIIYQEKQQKIIPENIKKDIQIFDIIGTYEGSGSSGSGDVKLFETEEQMQQDPNANEGDLAVVYRSEIQNMTADTQTQYINFPETVTLPSAITESYYCMLRAVDSSVMFEGDIQLDQTSFRFDGWSNTGDVRVSYTSVDGINYTRTTEVTNPVDLGTAVHVEMAEEWNDNFGYFMQIGGNTFEGLYEYDGTQYNIIKTQLNATADLLYNSIAYGKNGVIEGTITQNISNSFADVNAEIYCKIQQAYDNMEPRVLTDSDKTIDKNIYFIPTKSDGTLLLDTSNVTNMSNMFHSCSHLVTIPLLDTSGVTNMSGMFGYCSDLTTVPLLDTSEVITTQGMFLSCSNLVSIPQLDTSSVTNMSHMFEYCPNLTTIPLLNTNQVTDMSYMFGSCRNLTNIPQLDTSSVTTTQGMFGGCSSLTTIPLLDTSKVTNMENMFGSCSNLTTIPLLDTSKVTNMSHMFHSCSSLTTIPQLDTSSVTNMSHMFEYCPNLTTISQLNTSSVTDIYNMFNECPNLSDESLNNILFMCTNAVNATYRKTLAYIGLTEEQAQKCTTLSNYQTFLDAGWTTGY